MTVMIPSFPSVVKQNLSPRWNDLTGFLKPVRSGSLPYFPFLNYNPPMSSTLRQRLSPHYQRLYQTATMGALNPLLKPVHNGLIGLELALNRGLDALFPHEPPHPHLNEQVTILVKTFLRPRTLHRLLTSIRRFYPALPIIVVDDSPNAHPIPGVETVILPPDSGLSVGRMEGLKRVKTPYILLLDDDFVFYRHTRLGQAVALMEQHPTIDIMGGAVVNLPFFTVGDYQKAGLYSTAAAPTYPPGTLIGNLPTLDKVANFFIARSDRLRLVEWDANLKLVEHADFFTRARGILTTVYNQDFRCLHARTPFDKAYMHKRNDFLPYVVYLQKKYRGERNV